jgi:hypothetical protein
MTLASCTDSPSEPDTATASSNRTPGSDPSDDAPDTDTATDTEEEAQAAFNDELIEQGRAVMDALASDDAAALAELTDPNRGVTFSPYAYVGDRALTFMPDELADMMTSTEPLVWGIQDGKGSPIELTWPEYKDSFVLDRDYSDADNATVDDPQVGGNAPNNIPQYFGAEAKTVEFSFGTYFSSSLDWAALRLVFSEDGLVGVVRDVWTI